MLTPWTPQQKAAFCFLIWQSIVVPKVIELLLCMLSSTWGENIFTYSHHNWNLKHFISEDTKYSLIESNGTCSNLDGKIPAYCVSYTFHGSRESCEAYCTDQTSCVGYTYSGGQIKNCVLFVSDDKCSTGWSYIKSEGPVKTMNDLKPSGDERFAGFVCYGKTSGKCSCILINESNLIIINMISDLLHI